MPDMIFQALDTTGLNETADQVRAIVQAAKSEIDAELDNLDYAQPDGIYPDMTVGAVIGADETAQWATRESTGTGSATVRSVQGAAVAWNQLTTNAGSTTTLNGVTFTNNGDGSWTVSGTANADSTFARANGNTPIVLVPSHVYLITGCPEVASSSTCNLNLGGTGYAYADGAIWTNPQYTNVYLRIQVNNGATLNNEVFWPQIFDLTQMFGSGNEPTTVAEFERMFPEAYYPYSAPTLKPVQIAGIASTDAQGGELDAIEWPTFTLRGAGAIGDMLYSDHIETRVGVVDLGTLTWFRNEITAGSGVYAFENGALTETFPAATTNLKTAPYPCVGNTRNALLNTDKAMTPWNNTTTANIGIRDDAYTTAADFKAAMSGVYMFYELATPTTTPISPALPMTYRVQAGGSESIIVPAGEISAAPVITIAEPVNMSTELTRIWSAIEALQGSRDSALGSVRIDSDVSSTEVKEAPTMDEKQTTERESEV